MFWRRLQGKVRPSAARVTCREVVWGLWASATRWVVRWRRRRRLSRGSGRGSGGATASSLRSSCTSPASVLSSRCCRSRRPRAGRFRQSTRPPSPSRRWPPVNTRQGRERVRPYRSRRRRGDRSTSAPPPAMPPRPSHRPRNRPNSRCCTGTWRCTRPTWATFWSTSRRPTAASTFTDPATERLTTLMTFNSRFVAYNINIIIIAPRNNDAYSKLTAWAEQG